MRRGQTCGRCQPVLQGVTATQYYAIFHTAMNLDSSSLNDLTWLDGKVVCITGVTNGIGESLVGKICLLDAKPAKLILLARNKRLVEEVASRVVASGIACETHVGDLGRPQEVERMAKAVSAKNSKLHCLMNNGGVWLADKERVVLDSGLEAHFSVNFLSMVVLVTALLPLLRASAPARVVVTGSALYMVFAKGTVQFDDLQRESGEVNMGGKGGLPSGLAYAHSKVLQYCYCKHLAALMPAAGGVTLNIADPGACLTPNQPIFSNCTNMWPFLRCALYRTPAQGAEPLLYAAAARAMDGVHGSVVSWGTWKFYYPKRAPVPMETQPGALPIESTLTAPSVADAEQCARIYELAGKLAAAAICDT